MPPTLHEDHQKLSAPVDTVYQPNSGKKSYLYDAERVDFLFKLNQRITSMMAEPES
jgi:hypothetical protein